MKKLQTFHLLPLLILLLLTSCEDPGSDVFPSRYDEGVFVVNEGNYNAGNASLTYFRRSDARSFNGVYALENNNLPLGDVAQSMSVHQGRGYVVLNNSGKVEVVDLSTLQRVGTITGIAQPRYLLAVGPNKAYLSYWGSTGVGGGIAVVDLGTLQVTGTLLAGAAVEQMLLHNGKVYATRNGGFGSDNRLVAIDPATDQLLGETIVGDSPESVVAQGQTLYVLCNGRKSYSPNPPYALDTANSTPASLWEVEAATLVSGGLINGADLASGASDLVTANGKLYFLYGGKLMRWDPQVPANGPTVFVNGNFYAFGYHADENLFYLGDPVDYQSEGTVYRYAADGTLLGTFSSGVIPGGFAF
jgi:hypothetical protein